MMAYCVCGSLRKVDWENVIGKNVWCNKIPKKGKIKNGKKSL